VLVSVGVGLAGLAMTSPLVITYLRNGLTLPPDIVPATHLAVAGLVFVMAAFLTFVFVLLVHAASRLSTLVYGPA
jgi:hypothetical protein